MPPFTFAALNPQPLPPRIGWVLLNPQPLPPRSFNRVAVYNYAFIAR